MDRIKQFYGVENFKSIKTIFKVNLIIYVPVLVVTAFYEDLPFYGRNTIYSNFYYLIRFIATLILVISLFIIGIITVRAIFRYFNSL